MELTTQTQLMQLNPIAVPTQQFNSLLFYRYIKFIDCKETTKKGYITAIKRFNDYLLMEGITQPNRATILAYKAHLKATDLANSSQHYYLRAVKNFFKWCDDEGHYQNITKGIKLPKVRNDQHRKDALDVSDVAEIADTINRDTEEGKRLYAIYLLSVTLGLRTIEIHRANIEDIKLLKGHPFIYLQGKGHDDKDQRKALPTSVYEAIQDYLSTREAPTTAGTPLFTSTSNNSKGKRIATTTISTMLKKMLVNAGYDSDRITAHSLRHTAGTTAYNVSKDIYATSKYMRHEDVKTTEIYVHDTNEIENEIELSEQIASAYFNPTEETTREKLERLLDALDDEQQQQALEVLERTFNL